MSEIKVIEKQTQTPSPADINMVQSRIMVAQKIDRDQDKLIESLKKMFQNKVIADFYSHSDKVLYAVPRKGKDGKITYIQGLGIHAIKDIASLYRHLDFGVEITKFNGKQSATGVAWCLDLKQNTCEKRQFMVYFPDRLKQVKSFSDEAYKIIYSEGVRRMRSCIERILPLWLTESFKERVEQLQAHGFKDKPAVDWVHAFSAYESKVKQSDIDALIKGSGFKKDSPESNANLNSILNGLKMGETTTDTVFPWIINKADDDNNEQDIDKVKSDLS